MTEIYKASTFIKIPVNFSQIKIHMRKHIVQFSVRELLEFSWLILFTQIRADRAGSFLVRFERVDGVHSLDLLLLLNGTRGCEPRQHCLEI